MQTAQTSAPRNGTVRRWALCGAAFLAALANVPSSRANSSGAFTYQGSLKQSGSPINSTADFQFGVWTAASGGFQVGNTQTVTGVQVKNGLFTVTLNANYEIGGYGLLDGQPKWLNIAVRSPSGVGSYVTLTPRQGLTSAPYALSFIPGVYIGPSANNPIIVGSCTVPSVGYTNPVGLWADSVTDPNKGWAFPSEPTGVTGGSDTGYGVAGRSWYLYGTYGINAYGTGYASAGAYGKAFASQGIGVLGEAPGGVGVGVWGNTTDGYGVVGVASDGSAGNYGVYGATASIANGWGVYSSGDLGTTTNFYAGGTKFFRIDHPLDPANMYLQHACVESNEAVNMYKGHVTTDANGDATIQLPRYFDALNTNVEYHLTVIGQFAQAIVAQEIKDNEFTIKTDKPNVKVSWQVLGARQDGWVKAHPVVAEVAKPASERGKYIHPELFGATADLRINAAPKSRQAEPPHGAVLLSEQSGGTPYPIRRDGGQGSAN
jgi:hypothetical protein